MQRELVGYDAFTQLQPWHFVRSDECFWANERWADVCDRRLFVFARRQDNDDLACFHVDERGIATRVIYIQGWTKVGFEVIQEFPDFWEWLKAVIDDIAEWVAMDESTLDDCFAVAANPESNSIRTIQEYPGCDYSDVVSSE